MLAEVLEFDRKESTENEIFKKGSYGQGNVLLNAAYCMPLYCKRLILLGLSKISYADDDMSDDSFTFSITAKEWQQVYGGDGANNAYAQMRKAAYELFEEKTGSLWYAEDEKQRGRRWFDELTYHKGSGVVELEFARKIRPNLKNLVKGGDYTPVDLEAICNLQSTYSIRLYELCRQYRKTGVVVRSVADFRRAFRLENKYTAFGDLRKRIIEPSIAEIQRETPIENLQWAPIKKGPKIISLRFTFSKEGSTLSR